MKAEVVLYARVRIAFPEVFGIDAMDCIRQAEMLLPNHYPQITPITEGGNPEIIFAEEYVEAMVTTEMYPDGMDFRSIGGFWEQVENGSPDEDEERRKRDKENEED